MQLSALRCLTSFALKQQHYPCPNESIHGVAYQSRRRAPLAAFRKVTSMGGDWSPTTGCTNKRLAINSDGSVRGHPYFGHIFYMDVDDTHTRYTQEIKALASFRRLPTLRLPPPLLPSLRRSPFAVGPDSILGPGTASAVACSTPMPK